MPDLSENPQFLTTQIITYIGNKRTLIKNIEEEIRAISKILNKSKMVCADIFSGSRIVARMMKRTFPKPNAPNFGTLWNDVARKKK